LAVANGELKLKEFCFTLPQSLQNKKAVALKGEAGGKVFPPVFSQEGSRIRVKWAQPMTLKAGESLAFDAQF
jgi:hypothetical protein